MNSRGLDLQPTDIFKADIIGDIEKQKREEFSRIWEDTEDSLGRDVFNDLFSYIRIILNKEKPKKTLLEDFRKNFIKETNNPENLINDIIVPYAKQLMLIKNSKLKKDPKEFTEMDKHLHWLNKIGNSDWIPVAIMFMHKYKHDVHYITLFLKKLDRLAACLHICSKNTNSRITRYLEVISDIEKNNRVGRNTSKIELTKDEKKKMKEVLKSDIYKLKTKINYIVLRLESFISKSITIHNPTVEYVLSLQNDEDSEWAKTWSEKKIEKNG